MTLEVYQVQTIWKFRGKSAKQTFHFLLDNTDDHAAFDMARQVVQNLFVTTNWGLALTDLITQQAFLRSLNCWRVLPTWGPGSRQRFSSDVFPGRWVGQMCDNFITANISWHHDIDLTGKHQTRVGPIGAGATASSDWFPLFRLAAEAFILEHRVPRVTGLGYSFQGCNLTGLGIALPITSGQLHWPPGRQANRRWGA